MKRKRAWQLLAAGVGCGLLVVALIQWNNGPQASAPPAQPGVPGTPAVQEPVPTGRFAIRGVVEGFYGAPWTHEQRLDMFTFLGQQQYNTYVYAPKDDPWQRLRWAETYPAAEAARMQELVQAARQHGLGFVYSVSPGLPIALPSQPITPEREQLAITYSSADDRAKLLTKLEQARSWGVQTVMLSFDDVQEKLHDKDRGRYGTDVGLAQTELANYVLAEMKQRDPNFQLWFAPLVYAGVKDNAYWSTLRTKLDPSIEVIWTGPNILAKGITSQQADQVAKHLGRKPLIWDNFPVNDYTYEQDKRPQLLLGPLEHRAPDLGTHVAGLLANPMIQPQASKLSLATIANYLNHPMAYQPTTAWQQALQGTDGVTDHEAWQTFASYASTSFLQTESRSAFAALLKQLEQSGSEEALRQELVRVQQLPQRLAAGIRNEALMQEIKPWVDKLGRAGEAALLALEIRKNPQDPTKKAQLRTLQQSLQADPHRIADEILLFLSK